MSNPMSRKAPAQSSRRSTATALRSAVGAAPRSASVRRLEFDHLRLVDLVDHRSRRPRQPVGACVEPGGQDDGLAHTRRGGVGEEVVEEPGPNRHPLGEPLRGEGRIVVGELDFAVHHLDEGVDADRVDQWLGEGIVDQGVGAFGRHRASGGHRGGGGAHAGRQIPAVAVVSSGVACGHLETSYLRVAMTETMLRNAASASSPGKTRP